MRPRLERGLADFSELAKTESSGAPSEVGDFDKVLDWHLDKAARRQETSAESQRRIYEIQKEKQKIMDRLKDWLACLDDSLRDFEQEEGSRDAFYNETEKKFTYFTEIGEEREATFGEIITDIDWNVLYSLDKNTVPRNLLKQYFIQRTKNDLRQLLNQQIIISESQGEVAIPQRREAYLRYQEALETGRSKEQTGVIAETIVRNILKKISYDSDVDFEIVETDIFQDVEQKVDFIIHFTSKNRGVGVTAQKDKKDIGIQFTTNPEAVDKKRYQVEGAKRHITPEWHVDDLVLVVFPLGIARELVKRWQSDHRPAGGPDKYLNSGEAERLFKTLLNGLTSQDQIEKYWKNFANYFPK